MKKEKTKTMVQQGTYIPVEVAKFLKQKAEERYPRIAPARLASEILVQWAIDNGMEKPEGV
jgi:hypothetical protein